MRSVTWIFPLPPEWLLFPFPSRISLSCFFSPSLSLLLQTFPPVIDGLLPSHRYKECNSTARCTRLKLFRCNLNRFCHDWPFLFFWIMRENFFRWGVAASRDVWCLLRDDVLQGVIVDEGGDVSWCVVMRLMHDGLGADMLAPGCCRSRSERQPRWTSSLVWRRSKPTGKRKKKTTKDRYKAKIIHVMSIIFLPNFIMRICHQVETSG